MRCRMCARWCARQWEISDRWERAHSNESDLWYEEPLRTRELNHRAYDSQQTDPAAAFALYLEAAEAGSAWAMEAVAWHYETGTAVAADLYEALDHYHRAICAGSWMATISYARLLADLGHHDACEKVLRDGVAADFVPASFWLAWLRHKRCKSREVRREIRPMLEYAAGHGHPVARIFLAQLLMRGKFGLRGIPTGLRLANRWASADEDVDAPSAAVLATGGA